MADVKWNKTPEQQRKAESVSEKLASIATASMMSAPEHVEWFKPQLWTKFKKHIGSRRSAKTLSEH